MKCYFCISFTNKILHFTYSLNTKQRGKEKNEKQGKESEINMYSRI